ncbi:SpoIIE family protein phosphatase [Planctomycetota bacterium]|nr:SpoIIE family protein phosphatase [Planctomycetota bacterium]
MVAPVLPRDEVERIADLRALRILDTPSERRYEGIVHLACGVAGVPMSYIAMIDSDRQWLKAKCGLSFNQTGRDESFCGHTILQEEPLIVEDATKDERFCDNPLVLGRPMIRFYAGFPLKGPGGHNIGTLCLADKQPRHLDERVILLMKELVALTEHELRMVDLIGTQHELIETKRKLERMQSKLRQELHDASAYMQSLIPDPIASGGPLEIDWRYLSSSVLGGDLLGYHAIDRHRTAVYLIDVCGHGVSSSLLASSVFNTIRNQTLPRTRFGEPKSVIESLNRAFPMSLHQNKFFTIWYGVYNDTDRTLLHSCGGHHPASLLSQGEEFVKGLGEPNFMIGAMPAEQFDAYEESSQISEGAELYLFSDGAFEIKQNGVGELLGLKRFNEMLIKYRDKEGDNLDTLINQLQKYQGSETFMDDVSIMRVKFR